MRLFAWHGTHVIRDSRVARGMHAPPGSSCAARPCGTRQRPPAIRQRAETEPRCPPKVTRLLLLPCERRRGRRPAPRNNHARIRCVERRVLFARLARQRPATILYSAPRCPSPHAQGRRAVMPYKNGARQQGSLFVADAAKHSGERTRAFSAHAVCTMACDVSLLGARDWPQFSDTVHVWRNGRRSVADT